MIDFEKFFLYVKSNVAHTTISIITNNNIHITGEMAMTLEQYNQLPYDYAHCAGTHCEKANHCLLTQPTRYSK